MPKFDPLIKNVVDEMLLGKPYIRPGKMFGFPAYYVGSKLGFCIFEEGVSFKLPRPAVEKLLAGDANAIPFQPYDRHIMREWVQVNLRDPQDYRKYQKKFEETISYLKELQGLS